MFGYDYEEFIIECLKFKIPLYEYMFLYSEGFRAKCTTKW